MIDRQTINDSFYCARHRSDGVIFVMTTGEYTMAEYDEQTGNIRWYRVVNATQRENLHNWLKQRFPVKGKLVKPKVVAAKSLPAKAIATKAVATKPAAKPATRPAAKPAAKPVGKKTARAAA